MRRVLAFVTDLALRDAISYLMAGDSVEQCHTFACADRAIKANAIDCLVLTQRDEGRVFERDGLHFAMHLIDNVSRDYWPKEVVVINAADAYFAHIQAVFCEVGILCKREDVAL